MINQLLHSVVDYNFGMIEFNWGASRNDSSVTTKIIDIDGVVRLQNNIQYKDLLYNEHRGNEVCSEKLSRRFKTIKEYYTYYRNNPIQTVVLLVYLCFILLILFIFWVIFRLIKLFFTLVYRICKFLTNHIGIKFSSRKKKEE